MSKLKKFLLLIPTAFIMLLNCMSFTAFAEDETDFPVFLDPSEYTPYDFADINALCSELNMSYVDDDYYYFYCSYFSESEYNNYLSGSDYKIISLFFFNKNVTSVENSDVALFKNSQSFKVTSSYSSASDSFTLSSSKNGFSGGFYYDKNNGSVDYTTSLYSLPTTISNESFVHRGYYLFQGTNIPDFPLVPDYSSSGYGSALDVEVNFDPEMSGDFQRREIINDKIVTIDTLNFSVTNNSKFSIQYLVAIVSQDDFFSLYSDNAISHPNGKVYSGDPTYVYVSDEWCYLPSGTKGITSTYCPSSWHHVDSGDVDKVTVKFNQMKLNVGVIYNVYVYAVKNTQDSVCVIPFNQDSYQYNEDYVLNFAEAQVVYSSQFTCSNPAEFDPDSNSGSYAFDGSDTSFFNRANGYIDENGNVVIDRIDTDSLISGSDSWGSQFDKNAWDVYYDRQNSVSSDLTQLSNNFSSFFRFINKVFGYFPKNYQSVISLGLTSLVVLGIIKVVIK